MSLRGPHAVSFSVVTAGANTLVSGLRQVDDELAVLARQLNTPPEDRFATVMEAFARGARPSIAALRSMVDRLEVDLRGLLAYFGEQHAGEAKPEELFSTIVSFSHALLAAAQDVALAEPEPKLSPAKKPTAGGAGGSSGKPALQREPTMAELLASEGPEVLLNGEEEEGGDDTLKARAKRSLQRGAFDEAIKSLRAGARTTRKRTGAGTGSTHSSTLSRMFLTGPRADDQ